MNLTLPLEQMSTREKLSMMELLWDDLCQNNKDIAPPTWHKDILDQRQAAIDKGDAEFIDWEQAKKNIRQAVE